AGQSSEISETSLAVQANAVGDNAQPAASYRLSGEKSLRPVRIGDDGTHMYLEWSEEQALPAVFALNALGEEEMVDGYMRQGIFTIDRVHPALVFRIGKKRALAKRVSR
ncbi:MAG: TrbG/VirB9 family P-type conjugative transfer protein, partial [Gammaproteobacteria bacterium]